MARYFFLLLMVPFFLVLFYELKPVVITLSEHMPDVQTKTIGELWEDVAPQDFRRFKNSRTTAVYYEKLQPVLKRDALIFTGVLAVVALLLSMMTSSRLNRLKKLKDEAQRRHIRNRARVRRLLRKHSRPNSQDPHL